MLVELVRRIEGLPRHLGQHSGGMVIGAGPLDEIVPLEPATMPGRIVVQWDKDDCADLGIIKIDLLGLGMLAVLEEAIPLVRAHEGVEVDLAHLPADDPEVYAMLRGGYDRRVPGREPRADGDAAADEAAHVLRPGGRGRNHPARADRRPHGSSVSRSAQRARDRPLYDHPALEPILKRTLGVPLFQEQLLADGDDGRGLQRRRGRGIAARDGLQAIDRKDGENRTAAARRDGAQRYRRCGRRLEIVRSITSFALYGFPESHAASFALIAYARLKALFF
jgi:error-prone DNA polymerase